MVAASCNQCNPFENAHAGQFPSVGKREGDAKALRDWKATLSLKKIGDAALSWEDGAISHEGGKPLFSSSARIYS